MGFNKRYIDRDKILNAIKNGNASELKYGADAIIMDTWSSSFYENYDFEAEYVVNRKKLNDDVQFSSDLSKTIQHENFSKLKKLSNILENLINDPTWTDILLTFDVLGSEGITNLNRGKFPKLKELAIAKILSYYTIESRNGKIETLLK